MYVLLLLQMAVRLVNVCSEKYKLKGEIDKLRSKPLVSDHLCSPGVTSAVWQIKVE